MKKALLIFLSTLVFMMCFGCSDSEPNESSSQAASEFDSCVDDVPEAPELPQAECDNEYEDEFEYVDDHPENILEPIRDTEMTWNTLTIDYSSSDKQKNLYDCEDFQERFFTIQCTYPEPPEWFNGRFSIVSRDEWFCTDYELEGTSSVSMDEVIMKIPGEYIIDVCIDKDDIVESIYWYYHGEITTGRISVDGCSLDLFWNELDDMDGVLTGEINISAYIEYITPDFETNSYKTHTLEYDFTVEVTAELLDYYYE